MDEIWTRVGLVVGALVVAAGVASVQRWRAGGGARALSTQRLSPGIYYFSSASCAGCESARRKLDATLGEGGYKEMAWEREPGLFDELGIDSVPAVLVVGEGGRGRLYPGQPHRVLARR